MSDILKIPMGIDSEFFRIKEKVNRPKLNHLVWKDESRLSLRVEENEETRVCKEIARIAGMEAKI